MACHRFVERAGGGRDDSGSEHDTGIRARDPAGVLSDVFDRRKLLIIMQLVLASVSATLMLLSYTGALTVGLLVALTFVGGVGAAAREPDLAVDCTRACP